MRLTILHNQNQDQNNRIRWIAGREHTFLSADEQIRFSHSSFLLCIIAASGFFHTSNISQILFVHGLLQHRKLIKPKIVMLALGRFGFHKQETNLAIVLLPTSR